MLEPNAEGARAGQLPAGAAPASGTYFRPSSARERGSCQELGRVRVSPSSQGSHLASHSFKDSERRTKTLLLPAQPAAEASRAISLLCPPSPQHPVP